MLQDNIINLRNAHNYSQEEVAEKIGISRQAYAKWEKGETVPDIEKCALLAKLYNTSISGHLQGKTGCGSAGNARRLYAELRGFLRKVQRSCD